MSSLPSSSDIASLHSKDVALLLFWNLKRGDWITFITLAGKYAVEPKPDGHRGFLYIRELGQDTGVLKSQDPAAYQIKIGVSPWMSFTEYLEWWKADTSTAIARINVGRSILKAIEGKAQSEEVFTAITQHGEETRSISAAKPRRSLFSS